MRDEESGLLTQNEALDRPLALTFLFLQDSHFKVLGRFGLGCRLVAGGSGSGVPKVCIIISNEASNGYKRSYTEGNRITLSQPVYLQRG